jgi:hypothetical protein
VKLSGARSLRRQTKALYPEHRHFSEPHPAYPRDRSSDCLRTPQPAHCARAEQQAQTSGKVLSTAAGATNTAPTDSDADNLTNRPRVLLQFQTKGLCLGSQHLSLSLHSRVSLRTLTVKLRGRPEAPDGAAGAQFLSARGAYPQAHHGPLQRLLEGLPSSCILRPPEDLSEPLPAKYQPDRNGKLAQLPQNPAQ